MKLQVVQSPDNKHSYRFQNLHFSPLASRSLPCTRLASGVLRVLESLPSTGKRLSLAVPLDTEESYFLQGPPWDQDGPTRWVWGVSLEEMNHKSERIDHFPGHQWSLRSIKREDSCWPFLGLFENISHKQMNSLLSTHTHIEALLAYL